MKKCGMIYKIAYHPLVFKEDKPQLPKAIQRQIERTIREKILSFPARFGLPLRQSLKGHRRIRVGNYRIIYRTVDDTVFVLKIGHRSKIYKKAVKRLVKKL